MRDPLRGEQAGERRPVVRMAGGGSEREVCPSPVARRRSVRFGVVQDDSACACEWCGRAFLPLSREVSQNRVPAA